MTNNNVSRSRFPMNSSRKLTTDRRTLLRGATAAAMAASVPAIGAGARQATPGASPATEGFYPSDVEGVYDAYTQMPEPYQSYDGVPGNGGTVRAFILNYNPPPSSRDENQYWQELERRLGVTWEPTFAPQPEYGVRSATLIASGDIPDLFYLNPLQGAATQYQAMAQGAFLDLTPYVTGDALQQFKNLAAYPSYVWENSKFQGKIFGVPKPHQRYANIPFYRADWVEKLGLAEPTSGDAVREMLLGFTNSDPDGDGNPDTWGLGQAWGWGDGLNNQIFGIPNGWQLNDDGSLTSGIETDAFRQGLEFQRQLYADGAYHPDSAGMNFEVMKELFINGTTGLLGDGIGAFFGVTSNTANAQAFNPEARTTPVISLAEASPQGVVHNVAGFFGFTGIPSALGGDEERVLELLRILDYLASPFGSEEDIFLDFGIEGVHHEVADNGARIENDTLQLERSGLVFLCEGSPVYYYPQQPELGLEYQDLAKRLIAEGVDDPTWNLYSEAQVSEGPVIDQLISDQVTNIVTGRDSLDSWEDTVEQWRSRGGDQVRQEYEEALQDQ